MTDLSHVLTALNKVGPILPLPHEPVFILNTARTAGRRHRRKDHAGLAGRAELPDCLLSRGALSSAARMRLTLIADETWATGDGEQIKNCIESAFADLSRNA